MQLTAREDIEAPLDRVFAELTNFENIERQALRRGVDVQRTTATQGIEEGMKWHVAFGFRGKQRSADITLTEYSPPERVIFDSVSGGLEVHLVVDTVALSRTRTRISMTTELAPKTLSARLLVQSLKLAKGGIDKRFRARMGKLAGELEERLKRTA
ncbi:SRPBCC family protein [Pseudoponticoccus marisrubri]|uniref:DNA polymerase III subunit gamma/tau n=1 Tax=Pseudoponticoccus marisrubri TaxID=1685382 RepID=A0A0W7WFC9_9RHOB|nr:SRPBCC family protein [Pseudoponticoccus marisrubri]KUF09324.1 hypothetical protein AVJ23_17935 [Pseudoponticoccus marisrubri]